MSAEVRVEHGALRVLVQDVGEGYVVGLRDTLTGAVFAVTVARCAWVRDMVGVARQVAEATGVPGLEVVEAVAVGIEALQDGREESVA